jgi:fibronectin type 3 domain-containing protein
MLLTTGGCSGLGVTSSCIDGSLTRGTTYYYQVRAVNALGQGPPSSEMSATCITVPTPPQSLTATPGNGTVSLSWAAPSDNGGSSISDYTISRGTSSGTEMFLANAPNTTSFVDTRAVSGQTTYYEVQALNGAGLSPPSSEVSATPTGTTIPGTPTGLTATNAGSGQITLTWTAPAHNGGSVITNYNVYRYTDSNLSPLLLTSGGCSSLGAVLTCTDTGLTGGTAYFYIVAAVNSIGESDRSSQAYAIA